MKGAWITITVFLNVCDLTALIQQLSQSHCTHEDRLYEIQSLVGGHYRIQVSDKEAKFNGAASSLP